MLGPGPASVHLARYLARMTMSRSPRVRTSGLAIRNLGLTVRCVVAGDNGRERLHPGLRPVLVRVNGRSRTVPP
jgi:hypothetical protein